MRRYHLLTHTADVRLYVEAETLEELFLGAMEGMMSIMKHETRNMKRMDLRKEVKVASADVTSLLIDFLSEVLTQSQIEKAMFYDVKFKKFADTELEAEIIGTKVDGFDEDIKAVTWHGAEIVKNEKGLNEVAILFDI